MQHLPSQTGENAGPDGAPLTPLDLGPALHRHLVRARLVSVRMVGLQRAGRIASHAASVGQEGAIVGAALAARAADWLFPSARDWYVALARGMPLATYVHHAFGSAADPAKGHAAPDHAPGRKQLVAPPSGVAGAHLPQAVGVAWAAKIKKEPAAAIALFEESVAEGGDFHNALNFAGVMKAPVVFVSRSRAQGRARDVVERALAYGVASARADGSDALAVAAVVRAALARASAGKGATLIDVSGAAVDESEPRLAQPLDLGPDDPVVRLAEALGRDGRLPPGATEAIAREVTRELDDAIAAAEQAGPPARGSIFEDVYASVPAHLAEQRRMLMGG